MLSISKMTNHTVKQMSYCPRDTENQCGIQYRSM